MRHLLLASLLLSLLATVWTGCEKEETKNCTNSFTDDRDGEIYCIITIGTQTWMAENLRYITDSSLLNPLNPSTVNAEYGLLYNFSEVNMACPSGWHLPSDDEWKVLELGMGMDSTSANSIYQRGSNEGSQLKSTDGWDSSNNGVEGIDSYGFNALPAGEANPSYGPYFNLGENASFWTSTVYDSTGGAWNRELSYDKAEIARSYYSQSMRFSCRCVQD
jgi:uncharacterized protein (TIGR02145 family)